MPILPVTNAPQGQHYSDSRSSSPFTNGSSSGPTIGIPGHHSASGGYGYGQTGPAAKAAASSAGYYDPGRRRKSNDGMGGGPFAGFGASSSVRHAGLGGSRRRGSFNANSGGGGSSLLGYIPLFLRRLFRFPHMDFQFALWQMVYLCISPRIVYRNIHYHKQTKNRWARDDPAFMVILSGVLASSAIAWGLVYGHGMIGILRMVLFMIFVDFVVTGLIVATVCWTVANRFLVHASVYSTDQAVEWQYAFDIHCNAFMPVALLLYVLQLVFMKLLLKNSWITIFLGNSLYMTAIVYYCYITFLGYNALPFLRHPEMFLYPITIFVVLYVIALILGINNKDRIE
ncbi:Protein unc-50 [Actinomortierella wolfii]|nr:Protein unc-50 [Actinomortierella wolfii]